ncbi:hypothetical protein CDCA_CDCA03G0816 [Cyanidium caldarium]|uniref:Transcription factor DP n=1 Tax=Cyanidium caldarium TaxID=2771 RepID=A0AAV9IRU1_CYACA|nr:hypothetical protein CDCA_CDCA03G0816 [Cyanidium caldarium]
MRQSRGRRAVVAQREEKGLRQFAVRVCEKVEQKGETDYEGVATELVQELLDAQAGGERDRSSDDKNIRRRVYDALNVLCAIGVIRKERRRILWQGLPRPSQREMERLRAQLRQRSEQQRQKLEMLEDIKLQQDALRALLERNKREPAVRERGRRGGSDASPTMQALHLPFILVATDADAQIDVETDERDRHSCTFRFSKPFEVFDDQHVLRRLGLVATVPRRAPTRPLPNDTDGSGSDELDAAADDALAHHLPLSTEADGESDRSSAS